MEELKSQREKRRGFTLIELLVAITIFSLIIGGATAVFVQAIKAQRSSLANQELLDQASYLIEYMSRTLRMARKDLSGECIPTTTGATGEVIKYNYETNQERNRIKFLNHQNICLEFLLVGNQLRERKSSDHTAQKLPPEKDALLLTQFRVRSFKIATQTSWGQDDKEQPRVSFMLEIEGRERTRIHLQTTVSQRELDIKK